MNPAMKEKNIPGLRRSQIFVESDYIVLISSGGAEPDQVTSLLYRTYGAKYFSTGFYKDTAPPELSFYGNKGYRLCDYANRAVHNQP